MSFQLLSEPIRKYVRDQRWEELRPIQEAAISRIMSTDNNYILISRTASGKTEAAFLPILSKVDFREPGVQVLYISPLIALINDQFNRVESLCSYLDVTVTKWHGEAKKSLKEHLLKENRGIVLITPESLEAMLVNKPSQVSFLFGNLKYIVIDEIHSFIGNDRGTHLMSLLYRLQQRNPRLVNIVGLSATMSDEKKYIEVKQFTGNPDKTKILLDATSKEIEVTFRYFENKKEELPLDLFEDLYNETVGSKVLIFPNSRGKAEEVAVKLQRIASNRKGHSNYFSHHSSVDREVRAYVEDFVKNNKRHDFAIACTSTLELGIDIGTVNKVVQIDAAHSIASLIQRTGRSGRRNDDRSQLVVYSTNPWSLLQSLACWTLYNEKFIEPPSINEKPYDILLHQILSVAKGYSGVSKDVLIEEMAGNVTFRAIPRNEIIIIVDHLVSIDALEKIGDELVIGLSGERIVNSRDFYSVFKTEENFKVVHAGTKIGEVPLSPKIVEGENILLAARIWKIVYVDIDAKKIEVIKAVDGRAPSFLGQGGEVHGKIRERMLSLLNSDGTFDFVDDPCKEALRQLRSDFSKLEMNNVDSERPLMSSGNSISLYTFTSTRINRTLQVIFLIKEIDFTFDERSSCFEFELTRDQLFSEWKILIHVFGYFEQHLQKLIVDKPAIMDFSKWGTYLPLSMQVYLIKEKQFDIAGTQKFIETLQFVEPVV